MLGLLSTKAQPIPHYKLGVGLLLIYKTYVAACTLHDAAPGYILWRILAARCILVFCFCNNSAEIWSKFTKQAAYKHQAYNDEYASMKLSWGWWCQKTMFDSIRVQQLFLLEWAEEIQLILAWAQTDSVVGLGEPPIYATTFIEEDWYWCQNYIPDKELTKKIGSKLANARPRQILYFISTFVYTDFIKQVGGNEL